MGAVQSTKPVTVDRLVVVSSAPFEAVVARLEAAVGHPDMQAFGRDVAADDTYAELERIVSSYGRSEQHNAFYVRAGFAF